jgi:hypothetical protein
LFNIKINNMKEKYYLEDLKNGIYKVCVENKDFYSYSDYYNMVNKYYYSIDFVEDPEKVKAEKISMERERKIDLILS